MEISERLLTYQKKQVNSQFMRQIWLFEYFIKQLWVNHKNEYGSTSITTFIDDGILKELIIFLVNKLSFFLF